jgi:hypothetical protein
MINPILIKELSLRHFGLIYIDLSHWQSYLVCEHGQQTDVVSTLQQVKTKLSDIAEGMGGECYRSEDNVQFFVVIKSEKQDFASRVQAFFHQAADTTNIDSVDCREFLKKHGVVFHAGGCHFDDIAGIRKIWLSPKRAKLLSSLHASCVAHSVFLTDLPIHNQAHYLLASERLTTHYRSQVQQRISALLQKQPLFKEWLATVHITPEILPNIFDLHRPKSSDPISQTAQLMESICQDRARKAAEDPFYASVLLQG